MFSYVPYENDVEENVKSAPCKTEANSQVLPFKFIFGDDDVELCAFVPYIEKSNIVWLT